MPDLSLHIEQVLKIQESLKFSRGFKCGMNPRPDILRAIHDEIRAANASLHNLPEGLEHLQMLLLPEEEISEEEAARLDRLEEEAREQGIPWEAIKAEFAL